MFEKLISLLPFNPGMAHQLAFYGKRMREEAAIRRTGLVFMVLAFFIQFFAVIAPPVATVADSTNDLINGGITGAADAQSKCIGNVQHYKDILANFGVTCAEVGAATTVSLKSTDYNNQLYSMGRLPYGTVNSRTGKLTGEVPVNIPGVGTLYVRHLSSFDSGAYSTYRALKITNTHGTFWILYNCANLVTVNPPKPLPRCEFNTAILASSPQCVAPCKYNASLPATSTKCFQPCKYNSAISATDSQCFDHCPIAGKTNLPKSSPLCYAPCPYNSKISASSAQCFKPCQYNSAIADTSPECFQPCQYNNSIPATSPQCYAPCQYNNALPASSPDCKPCDKSVSSQDTIACVSVSKAATNVTAGIQDANGTTAHAGDVITYTLSAKNNGKAVVKAFIFQESLSDTLDYATLTDAHGGTLGVDNTISWAGIDIAPGATVTKKITVTIKNPIPNTPTSISDPGHFDHIMTNVYGNTININLPPTVITTAETANTTLVNTGPGTNLFLGAVIVILAGYFYSRSRLLALETTIALHDNAATGSM